MASKATMNSRSPNPSVPSSSQLTFNMQLWAYDPQIPDRQQNQVIRIEELSKPADRAMPLLDAYSSERCPGLMPRPEETVDLSDNRASLKSTAIWVGVRPQSSPINGNIKGFVDFNPVWRHVLSGNNQLSSNPYSKGTSILGIQTVHCIDNSERALRVVCPRGKATATYYALTEQNPDTGLCRGIVVEYSEVFFFPEFRDDTKTTFADRKKSWAEVIRKQLTPNAVQKPLDGSGESPMTPAELCQEGIKASRVISKMVESNVRRLGHSMGGHGVSPAFALVKQAARMQDAIWADLAAVLETEYEAQDDRTNAKAPELEGEDDQMSIDQRDQREQDTAEEEDE